MAEWFRALDLKSGGPWFKSSTLLLSGFVLGSPEWFRALDLKSGGPWFKSSTLLLSGFVQVVLSSTPQPRCVNSQLVSLPPVGILNSLCSILSIKLFIYSVSNNTFNT